MAVAGAQSNSVAMSRHRKCFFFPRVGSSEPCHLEALPRPAAGGGREDISRTSPLPLGGPSPDRGTRQSEKSKQEVGRCFVEGGSRSPSMCDALRQSFLRTEPNHDPKPSGGHTRSGISRTLSSHPSVPIASRGKRFGKGI